MFSIVPFEPIPNHSFSCVIPIDGGNVTLTFRMMYNELAEYWTADIKRNDETLLSGLPVIPAENILEQYKYLNIGSAWILPKTDEILRTEYPGANNLTTDWIVLWGDTDAGQ